MLILMVTQKLTYKMFFNLYAHNVTFFQLVIGLVLDVRIMVMSMQMLIVMEMESLIMLAVPLMMTNAT